MCRPPKLNDLPFGMELPCFLLVDQINIKYSEGGEGGREKSYNQHPSSVVKSSSDG